ncbi:MAG: Ig-like domain-containing protein [archaeon]|nr:Ig-like domain-containing protein [archaeon]
MKNKTVFTLLIICMFFLVIGTAFASDVGIVENTDNSNLNMDNNTLLSTNIDVSSDSNSNENIYENNQYLVAEPANGIATHINSTDLEMYYNQHSVFSVVLLDENDTPLSGQDITFCINGVNYTYTTNENGIASIEINLASRNYSVITYFKGTDVYSPSNVTNQIIVKPTITGKDVELIFQDGASYEVVCTDSKGNVLRNSLVVFNINGVNYNTYTNEKGHAYLGIGLYPGNYIISATNYATGETTSNIITVLSTIKGKNLVLYYNNGSSYSATFYNSDGTIIPNTDVQMNINGVMYNVRTNSQGVASLYIGLYPGVYIITSTNPVTHEMASNTITVLSTIESTDLTKYYLDSSSFTVKIVNGQGQPVDNAKVNFNINGVFYSANSNSEGIARLYIGLYPGEYIITSEYNGFARSNKVTVLPGKTKLNVEEQYVFVYEPGYFNATLTYDNGEIIPNRYVTFTVNVVSYRITTDSKGIAHLPVNLYPGDYLINVKFSEYAFYSSEASNYLHEVTSFVIIIAEDMSMVVGDGSYLDATLIDIRSNKPIANDTLTYDVHGVSYNLTTNNDGVASLYIGLYPGVYDVTISHSGYCQEFAKKVTSTVNKAQANVKSEDLYMMLHSGKNYSASFYDQNGNSLIGYAVTLTINGVSYDLTTNDEGTVSLGICLNAGKYTMNYELKDFYYTASGSNLVFVNGTIFIADNIYVEAGKVGYFPVKIVDPNNNPVSGITVTFILNNGAEVQTVVTDSNGVANAQISGYAPGTYNIMFNYPDFNGETKTGIYTFTVKNPITIADVVQASLNLKYYIEKNFALPSEFGVGDETVNLATYYYLACQAITALNRGDYSLLEYKWINDPPDPGPAENLGQLYSYAEVAQNCQDFMNNFNIAPESAGSDIGNIGYDGLVYAMCRVLAFYGTEGSLPAYVTIKSYCPIVLGILNQKNTITNLDPYLIATCHCEANNPAIESLANQLTERCTSDYEKALVIYNFVRDSIDYDFYYDTWHGAVGTLRVGSGNCCDQAHLVIALARAADLPARYNHGTCIFSDGTFGHVWPQILVGDIWVVADPTSPRNSFGEVNNWNNYNYQLISQGNEILF